ncbi:Protein kinase-like domain superfamily [Sesbania bispinosa]|nr:Protein kinase-like domain superfamily [Sesbania bispinosa]
MCVVVHPFIQTHNVNFHPPPTFGSSSNVELALGVSQLQVRDRDNYLNFYAHYAWPMHEITISTNDKPKLLSQLTSLLSETGLDIQEAHAFSTLDGYSLDVFVVGGWEVEKTEELKHVLAEKLHKLEKQPQLKENGRLRLAEQEQIGMNFISRHKIASGPFSDLYKGTFCNQDVAIKVLKDENLNENIQREFTQEVYILRVYDQAGIMTARNWNLSVDGSRDVFSFAIVLWELLTGKLPYENLSPLQAAVGVVQKKEINNKILWYVTKALVCLFTEEYDDFEPSISVRSLRLSRRARMQKSGTTNTIVKLKEDEEMAIEHLRKLNKRNISAWNMKRMIKHHHEWGIYNTGRAFSKFR